MVTPSEKVAEQGESVLGIPVSTRKMGETLDEIERLISVGDPCIVATADASGIAIAQSDGELREIYQRAALVTCDSNGVVWALGRKGVKADRVSGVDVADELCRLSAEKGYRIYFLGAGRGVADEAAEKMRLKYPGCNIVGSRHGFFPPSDDEYVAKDISAYEPDILLVALGIPRQEKFIYGTIGMTGAKVSIGVGGSFDVFSGRVKRAPRVIQKLKLEWLWRLILNPKKISKAMMLPKFMAMVLRSGR